MKINDQGKDKQEVIMSENFSSVSVMQLDFSSPLSYSSLFFFSVDIFGASVHSDVLFFPSSPSERFATFP